MEWPAFLKENLDMGSRESCAGVCTLWTERCKIALSPSCYAVKGNLYSAGGISYLLRNLLANPRIRYLAVCGEDRTGSGQALVDFFAGKGDFRPDRNLTPAMLEKIRANVNVLDFRGREAMMEKELKALRPLPAWGDPILVPEAAGQLAGMENRHEVFRVEGETVGDVWLNLLDIVMKFGQDKDSEYGLKQKEVINVTCVVKGEETGLPQYLPFDRKKLDSYIASFLSPERGDVNYSYGERLFSYEFSGGRRVDQVSAIAAHLKKSPCTRRAVASIWNAEKDLHSEHSPCMTQVIWNISQGRLHQTAFLRSNDIFGGWPFNTFALRELQRRVAKGLNLPVGDTITISNSAHIYENNFAAAQGLLAKHYTGRSMPFSGDDLGYFTISAENGELKAVHFTKSGKASGWVFRGKSAEEVYRKILHENLVSRMDHAAYLGAELARAEERIRATITDKT